MTSSNDRRNSERSIVEDSFEKELRDRARERLQEREDALHGAQHSTPQRKSKVGTEGKATLNGRHARHEAPSDALAPASPSRCAPLFWQTPSRRAPCRARHRPSCGLRLLDRYPAATNPKKTSPPNRSKSHKSNRKSSSRKHRKKSRPYPSTPRRKNSTTSLLLQALKPFPSRTPRCRRSRKNSAPPFRRP